MKSATEWIALILVIIVLYAMDQKHLAASNYNLFLIILIVTITALVVLLKYCFREPGSDDRDQ